MAPTLQSNFVLEADALKSKGNSLTEIGSKKVCGDRLCSEITTETKPMQESPTQKHPNIVFILTDNQSFEGLSVYGNKDVKTPNLDRLASEGILFNNVYAENGVCSPTRATIMTGLLSSQHGVHNPYAEKLLDELPEGWSIIQEFRTLPQTLSNKGYETAMIGKWHLGQPWEPALGFKHWIAFPHGHTVNFWNNTMVVNDEIVETENIHIVDFLTDKAVEYLESQNDNTPFFLQLNYDAPYTLPSTNWGPAENRFYSEYENMEFQSMPIAPVSKYLINSITGPWDQELWDKEKAGIIELDVNNNFLAAVQMQNDPESYANVLSQNTLIDDGVGRVLDKLDEMGLAENTLVVFSTDQGNSHGQHGHWGHTIHFTPPHLYDSAMKVPFIMRHTGVIEPGQVNDMMIGQYDFAPTLVDYAGIDVEFENSPGKSFVPMLLGEDMSLWGDEVYFEQDQTRGIRTSGFSYWDRLEGTGEPELYDMRKDPLQMTNVYGLVEYKDVIQELDGKLDSFFEEYADPKYDLWNGGTAKLTIIKPQVFVDKWGEDWSPIIEVNPKFEE